ncbi:tetratricopeptide repeat protein [Clavibacter sp. VKM Ac-2873]|uniref:tetratricopeptide repeat protein n=1 Tax=Clavibacter sp. VKM Ac-2873 TaxID=2783813 RepID=UPI00351C1549
MPDDPDASATDDAPNRARLLWDAGDRAEALALLKGHLRDEPRDTGARLALAGLYRELVAPDQAGRWGIASPGWNTEVERDRLARMIAHTGIADHEIGGYLALPADADLHAEVAALMPAIEMHRADFADPARTTRWQRKAARTRAGLPHPRADRPPRAHRASDAVEHVSDALWFISGALLVLGVIVVWVGALFGASVTALARWTVVLTLALLAVACVARAVTLWVVERERLGRRPSPADVDVAPWIIGGAVLAIAIVGLVTEGLRSGGPLPF